MKAHFSQLLIIPALAILSGGCAMFSHSNSNAGPPLESSLESGSPSFTADTTPDQPNYYWMADSPLLNTYSASTTYFPLPGGSNGASPGSLIGQPAGAR
jgi:hypothetical protein